MNNPPAFPQHPVFDATERVEYGGMTLRDYVAIKVLQALIIRDGVNCVNESFRYADDFLKAREQ